MKRPPIRGRGVYLRSFLPMAYNNIGVGGLIINDIPTYRMDHMPYGGTKESGMGRKGVKYAIEEMTEPKLLVVNLS